VIHHDLDIAAVRTLKATNFENPGLVAIGIGCIRAMGKREVFQHDSDSGAIDL
jgi:hypothetical protein